MSPVTISIRPVISYEPLIRAIAKFILATSVLGILFAGLFPFDFSFPAGPGLAYQVRTVFDSSPEPAILQDRAQNILFFVPFGFGLGAALGGHKRRRVTLPIVMSLVLGFALSMTVELLQVFLGFRDPTWMDVTMNTVGSGVGAAIAVSLGKQILEPVARQLAKLTPLVTRRNVTIVLVIYALVVLALPLVAARDRGSLQNWETGFPLLVGNETNGERGWAGTVWLVELASRAATSVEVQQITRAGTARGILEGNALIASYETLGPGPYQDQLGTLDPLTWVGHAREDDPLLRQAEIEAPTSQPAEVTPHRYLRTASAVAAANYRIASASQFTLIATVAPAAEDQRGPARIVSISGGTYRRNFSLMHDYDQLSLRLRTELIGPDGSAPEAVLDDVFATAAPKQIVVTYADTVMTVFIDGLERARMEITPEAALIWRLYPRGGWKVKLSQYGFRMYATVYRLLLLIPFAALLASATALSGMPLKKQWLVMFGAIVATALAMELILGAMSASGYQVTNLLISIVIATGAVALMRPPARRAARV